MYSVLNFIIGKEFWAGTVIKICTMPQRRVESARLLYQCQDLRQDMIAREGSAAQHERNSSLVNKINKPCRASVPNFKSNHTLSNMPGGPLHTYIISNDLRPQSTARTTRLPYLTPQGERKDKTTIYKIFAALQKV